MTWEVVLIRGDEVIIRDLDDYDPIEILDADRASERLPSIVFSLVHTALESIAEARGTTMNMWVPAFGEDLVRLSLGDITHEHRFSDNVFFETRDNTKAVVAYELLMRILQDLGMYHPSENIPY